MKPKSKRWIILLGAIFLLLTPSKAHAYVDPGIVGMMFQAVFTFLFGTVFFWITKPFKYIASVFNKLKSRFSSSKSTKS